jgi:uridylate kinase
MVAGGWKPGWSTDYVATMIAQEYDASTIINLSNIDFVYDKDPKKFKNAKKLTEIDWTGFKKLVGDKWDPGLIMPFDPIASQKAEKLHLEVAIMNGKKLDNLEKYLDTGKFTGTIIK